MKKRILAAILGLFLALGAFSELGMCEEADALYPIRENGRWGYMNRAGETVIPPAWEDAALFSGGVAVVTVDAEGHVQLIDRAGRPICDEIYVGYCKETPYCFLLCQTVDRQERWGWYDKQSGHLENCRYNYLTDCRTDSDLILAEWEENGAWQTAYLRRSTGERVITIPENGEIYSFAGFSEGYAYLCIEDADQWYEYMIDVNGQKVTLPDGMWPAGPVRDGVMVIKEAGGNYGVGRPDGTVVTMPEYMYIDPFSEGRAFFYPQNQQYDIAGILDTEGNVITEPTWTLDAGWFGADDVGFLHGYAVLLTLNGEKVWNDEYVILDRDGHEVYRAPSRPDEETTLLLQSTVMENGLLFYQLIRDKDGGFGLLRIRDEKTEDLTGPVFEEIGGMSEDRGALSGGSSYFSEGLCPVRQGGLYGYIDEDGQWALPPAHATAEPFQNGLTLTERDGKLQYIDHAGNVVWREP